MDYLEPLDLNKEQKQFVLQLLARKPNSPIEIKAEFEKLYEPVKIKGETIQKLYAENREYIKELRQQIYIGGIDDLPIAHAYTILAISQARVEDLAKNPKVVRTVKRFDENTGKEYWEEILEIDDANIQKYLKLAQDERFGALKLEIEKIVKEVDKTRLPRTGFKPVTINTGFEEQDEEIKTNS